MRIRFPFGRRAAAALLCSSLLLITGCTNGSVFLYDGSVNSGNFTNTLVLGDSFAAGFQNGSLCDKFQPNGWASLVAAQVGFSGNFVQPLIASPGYPNYTTLASYSAGPPAVVVTGTASSGVQTTGRDSSSAAITNFAVPGALVRDLINAVPATTSQPYPGSAAQQQQQLNSYVLTNSGVGLSQVGWAQKQQPTTIFLWVGTNDALLADITGSAAAMTSVTNFTNEYQNLLLQLTSSTNAYLVIANVPDVTQFPYMTPAATVLAEYATTTTTSPYYTGQTQTAISNMLGIYAGDLVNPAGMAKIVTANLKNGTQKALPAGGVLTAADVATVQANITAYNQVISSTANVIGATVVDMNVLYSNLQSTGYTLPGLPSASFNYLGGLFSMDGYTPTNTFNAIIANRFINAMNSKMGLAIPTYSGASIKIIALNDPLYGANIGVKTF
jgi:lysophospholipase L1-like esterase